MTTPRNEVFMSLGPEETAPLTTSSASTEVEVELAPPPPPAQGLAEFPEAKTPDSSDPDVSVVDMEMERRRYVEEGKRQTLKRY